MLQNYRFSGTFKTVTLTTVILNLSTYYQQVIHMVKILIIHYKTIHLIISK